MQPWIAFLTTTTAGAPDKLRVQLDLAGAEDADFVYTAGLRSRPPTAGCREVAGVHARGAATGHPQPQPRLRGLVKRARAH